MKIHFFLISIFIAIMSILVISSIAGIQACTPYENCSKIMTQNTMKTASFNGNHAAYGIPYTMSNGTLVASLLDLPAKELVFTFNATDDGKLTVELPRQTIDSTRDGKDKPYLVFVGTGETGTNRVRATETQNDNETRTLEIDFTKGDNLIGIVGTYFVENNSTSIISNLFGAWSPLQQYEKGFDAQDVICKSGLQLVIKAEDDTPACVKPESATKLVERGWAIHTPTIPNDETISQNGRIHESILCMARVVLHNVICPGERILHSCPMILFNTNSTVIARSGFVGVYPYNFYSDNYVIEPGHNGTITYTLTANHIKYSGPPLLQKIPQEIVVTNYATFFHQRNIQLDNIQKYPEIQLYQGQGGGGSFYSTCYELPNSTGEQSCNESQATDDYVSLLFYDHLGVNVLFDKKSETIGYNGSATITMAISVSPDAQRGTYWMVVSPDICMGGQIILFTVGDYPYS